MNHRPYIWMSLGDFDAHVQDYRKIRQESELRAKGIRTAIRDQQRFVPTMNYEGELVYHDSDWNITLLHEGLLKTVR